MNNSTDNHNNRQIILENIKKSATEVSRTVSAIAAIFLGEYLSDLRNEEADPKKFYQQAEDSSNRKKASIDSYIRLYEVFGLYKNIIPNWMIKAHLEIISDDLKKRQTVDDIEDLIKLDELIKYVIKLNESEKVRSYYSTSPNQRKLKQSDYIPPSYIREILCYSPNKTINSEDASEEIVKDLGEFSEEYPRKGIANPPPHGNDLKITEFKVKGIGDLMRYEPIDEQSFVGLFCLVFHLLKEQKINILINNKKLRKLNFFKIEYIRVKFPDAKIQFIDCNTNQLEEWEVEFEYLSSRYITHRHHREEKRPHLFIICWKDDLKSDHFKKYNLYPYFLPHVLSIEKLLMQGEIELRGA